MRNLTNVCRDTHVTDFSASAIEIAAPGGVPPVVPLRDDQPPLHRREVNRGQKTRIAPTRYFMTVAKPDIYPQIPQMTQHVFLLLRRSAKDLGRL